jgi:hypothetical protein
MVASGTSREHNRGSNPAPGFALRGTLERNVMPHRYRGRTSRFALCLGLCLAVLGVATAGTLVAQEMSSAQVISTPLELPKGPGTAGFDISRLNSENYGAFEPFYITDTQPLKTALDEGKVAQDTRLLVTDTAGGKVALLTDQMVYHHLAQGRDGGKDWLATF